jgi:hypothetical protein
VRAIVVLLAVTAGCAPEIVPGSYYCGPNASCPESQVCSEATHTCVLPGLAAPFDCSSDLDSEPDDTLDMAFPLSNLDCVTLPVVIDACMPANDAADWLRFTAPSGCAALEMDVRITFPVAFQRIGVEVIDVATGDTLAIDGPCTFQGESGNDLRCARAALVSGGSYAIRIAPTGEGDCSGSCAFNSYTVRVQLGPPD